MMQCGTVLLSHLQISGDLIQANKWPTVCFHSCKSLFKPFTNCYVQYTICQLCGFDVLSQSTATGSKGID